MSRFVEEVIARAPQTKDFEDLMAAVETRLRDRGYTVSTRYDLWVSSHSVPTMQAGPQTMPPAAWTVRISLKEPLSSPLAPLWDLLHEFGHSLQPASTEDSIRTLDRERRAWDLGWQVAASMCPKLDTEKKAFEEYRDRCLQTYGSAI